VREDYPLEQLAIIKQKKLEEAERILQEKKRALAKEEEKLRALEKERDEVKHHREAKLTQLRAKLDEGTTTDKIQQMKTYLKIVDEKLKQKEDRVKQQQKQVESARAEVEVARKNLFSRQKDIEKLAIHRKEWDKERKLQLEHQEGLEGDEIGSAMHILRKRAKKGSSHKKRGHR
jgi:flagellar biosynthesis chaperone FliJ